MVDPSQDLETYFASRRQGNWLILLALLVFISFTIGVTVWKWDTQEFLDITNEHHAEQERLDALRDLQRSTADRESDEQPGDTPDQ